jgi:hypothetical protein
MKKILLSIKQIERVVLNVDANKARLMVINENHENVYEHVHDFSAVAPSPDKQEKLNKVYEIITKALLEGKQYVEFEV